MLTVVRGKYLIWLGRIVEGYTFNIDMLCYRLEKQRGNGGHIQREFLEYHQLMTEGTYTGKSLVDNLE